MCVYFVLSNFDDDGFHAERRKYAIFKTMKPILCCLILMCTHRAFATFSILAYDREAGQWGIAVATNNIYVGNSTIYIQPGLGAFSVIAETEPAYAVNGFQQLRLGRTIQSAIEFTRGQDADSATRQVSGIDSVGNCYAFTGGSWQYEMGMAGQRLGKDYVVMGNQLAPSVLSAMASCFENTRGTLAQRLLAALVAGEKAGGQITGKQSAALVVKGIHDEWFNNIDLRVDDSRQPFEDLERLLKYHYGRIRLNQSIYAIRNGNPARGDSLLKISRIELKGWNGMQKKIAQAYILLGLDSMAAVVVRAAVTENPQWAANLPAFYLLRDRSECRGLIHPERFTEKDWIAAIDMTEDTRGAGAALAVIQSALLAYPHSVYLHSLAEKKPAP